MSETPHHNLQELFLQAVETPAENRSRWLEEHCTDEGMQKELAELLRYHDQGSLPIDKGILAETIVHEFKGPGSGGLHVRCPHCHNPIELVPDAELGSIECPSCGSDFGLIGDGMATREADTVSEVGQFRLIERVGMGAFGSVWKAHDTKLDRTVAVKIPRKGQFDAKQEKEFLREAQSAAQLNHSGIVPVYEVGRDGDTLFIVSEYVRGLTLSDWLTGQQPTVREAAKLCVKIAEALHHAHERGVIHRDLKPGNIMLDADGEPHLMDFGLAKREAGEITMTIHGQPLGTPAYMSPEQAQGDAHAADRRSDIYSLGVILFQLLSGELPFRGNKRMLIHQVIHDEPPSPRKLNSNVPKDLETICLKCMEKTPERRYDSTCDVGDELQRHLNGEPIQARPVATMVHAWRWCQRKPAAAALLCVLSLLAVLGPSVAAHQAYLQINNARLANEKEILAGEKESAFEELDKKNEELKDQMARNLLSRGSAECDVGRILDGITYFASACDMSESDPLLQSSARRLMSGWSTHVGTMLLHDKPISVAVFSPDGGRVLTASFDGTARLWDTRTGTPVAKPMIHSTVIRVAKFSRDGKKVLTGSFDQTARLWDGFTGKSLTPPMSHLGYVRAVDFSPDGQTVLTASYDKTAKLWNSSNGEQIGKAMRHDKEIHDAAFSPDGQKIVTASYDRTVRLWDVRTQEPLGDPMQHDKAVYSVAFSPDGSTILSGEDFYAQRWNANTTEPVGDRMKGGAFVVAYSPDGQYMLTGGVDNAARLWNAQSGDLIGEPYRHQGAVVAVGFAADGRTFMTGSQDRRARLWLTETGRLVGQPIQHHGEVRSVAFHPHRNVSISGSYDGAARFWDALSGKPIKLNTKDNEKTDGFLNISKATIDSAIFSPDGRFFFLALENHVQKYDAQTGLAIGGFLQCTGTIRDFDLSPDGLLLVVASDDNTVQSWDLSTSKRIELPIAHKRAVSKVVIHPSNGTVFTVGGGRNIRGWEMATGRLKYGPVHDSSDIRAIVPSHRPNGILETNGESVWLWDLSNKKRFRKLRIQHDQKILDIAVSPDGQQILTGSEDDTARLWNVKEGLAASEPFRHDGDVLSVDFSPDGHTAITGCEDGTVRLWDVYTGRQLRPSFEHAGPVSNATMSPDGNAFLSTSIDSNSGEVDVRLWKMSEPEITHESATVWSQAITGLIMDGKGYVRSQTQAEWMHFNYLLQNNHFAVSDQTGAAGSNSLSSPAGTSLIRPPIVELRKHVAKEVTVEFDVEHAGQVYGHLYLNSMVDYFNPDCVTIELDENQLPSILQLGFTDVRAMIGARVKATGKLSQFQSGRLRVVVSDPKSQLRVVVSNEHRGSPESAFNAIESAEHLVPSIEEIRRLVGQVSIIEFRVKSTGGLSHLYLNSHSNWKNPNCFSCSFSARDMSSFESLGISNPKEDLLGKIVRVAGELEDSNGRVGIRITDLSNQLIIVEPTETPTIEDSQ